MNLRNILFLALLAPAISFGQTRMPAKQVLVDPAAWTNIAPDTNTVQSVFDFLDAGGLFDESLTGGYGTNTFVNPGTWQYLLETPTTPTGGVVSGFYLPGTNIVGATYDATNETWVIDTSTDVSQQEEIDYIKEIHDYYLGGYSSPKFRVLTNNVTLTITNGMTLDQIYVLGKEFDYIDSGTLTYQFEPGTYVFSNSFLLNSLLPAGSGRVNIYGTRTSNDPNVIIKAGVTNSYSLIAMARSGFNGPVFLSGFTVEGHSSTAFQNGISATDMSTLIVTAPMSLKELDGYGLVAANYGMLDLWGFSIGGLAIKIYGPGLAGALSRGIYAVNNALIKSSPLPGGSQVVVFDNAEDINTLIESSNLGNINLRVDSTTTGLAGGLPATNAIISTFNSIVVVDTAFYNAVSNTISADATSLIYGQ